VLDVNFTTDIRATVVIGELSSQTDRVLSETDFEFMVDCIADALEVEKEIGNLSVGATIRTGEFEVTFTLDAGDFGDANARSVRIFNTAHAYALQMLAERLGQRNTEYLKASETRVAELVG